MGLLLVFSTSRRGKMSKSVGPSISVPGPGYLSREGRALTGTQVQWEKDRRRLISYSIQKTSWTEPVHGSRAT